MDETTRQQLIAINADFYERHAESFSSTRDHPWPGWKRVVAGQDREGVLRVLDVGCGNGRLASFLRSACTVDYVGVDTSRALVEVARSRFGTARFEVCDALDAPPGPFDLVAVFGLMHHVPGFEQRVEMLAALGGRLAPAGRLAVTFWRFGNDPRFEGRLRGFDESIDASELEPGDHRLLWGDGGEEDARYCHFCDDAELERVVAALDTAGFDVVDRFLSDGRGGEFNQYLVWSRR